MFMKKLKTMAVTKPGRMALDASAKKDGRLDIGTSFLEAGSLSTSLKILRQLCNLLAASTAAAANRLLTPPTIRQLTTMADKLGRFHARAVAVWCTSIPTMLSVEPSDMLASTSC